jgi:hypothetical protein
MLVQPRRQLVADRVKRVRPCGCGNRVALSAPKSTGDNDAARYASSVTITFDSWPEMSRG